MPRPSKKVQAQIQGASDQVRGVGQFVSVERAAELLSVSKVTIRRYLGLGKLRKFKVGSRTLLRHDDVMGLIREVSTPVTTTK